MSAIDDQTCDEKMLVFARYCGAEARANNRKNINADDREDIADNGGYKRWVDMPIGFRQAAISAFYLGWRNENNQ
jgi:hypothetical protein